MLKKLNLISIFLVYSLDSFGIAIAYPIFTPIFFSPNTPFFAPNTPLFYRTMCLAILLALFPIAQFFSVPFIGDYSDKIGRKKTFTFTLLGSAFSYLIAAAGIYFHSISLLCLSRFSSGIFAGNTSLCFATLSDMSVSDEERGKNFGLLGAFGGLSFLISILCGEYFFNNNPSFALEPAFPFLIIAALSVGVFLIMKVSFYDTKCSLEKATFHFSQGYHHIVASLNNPILKNCYLVYFFFAIGWIAVMQFYPPILLDTYKKPPVSFTTNLVIVGAMWSFANLFVQRILVKRFSPKQILWLTIPLLLLFLLACLPPQSYVSFSIHFSLAVFMAALTWTNTFANVSVNAPREIQGRIMGINQSFTSIATIVASLAGGVFAAKMPTFVLVLSVICMALSLNFLRKQIDKKT